LPGKKRAPFVALMIVKFVYSAGLAYPAIIQTNPKINIKKPERGIKKVSAGVLTKKR